MVFTSTAFLLLVSAASAEPPSPLAQFAPLIFIGVIFYFLLIRPQQKQRKEQLALISAIKVGDKVVTASGMYGLISSVKEKTVMLKVADNVKIEFDKAAIASVVKSSTDTTVDVSATPAS